VSTWVPVITDVVEDQTSRAGVIKGVVKMVTVAVIMSLNVSQTQLPPSLDPRLPH